MRSIYTIPVAILSIAPIYGAAQSTQSLTASGGDMVTAQPLPAGAACLSRPFTDANGVSQPNTIYVPAAETAIYQAKGFVPGACGAVSLEVHRARICHLALYGNDAVQTRLEQVLGAKPKDLCESVKKIAPFPVNAGG